MNSRSWSVRLNVCKRKGRGAAQWYLKYHVQGDVSLIVMPGYIGLL